MKFIRIKELEKLIGLSRTTIWRQERSGKFPARRIIGKNSVAWLLHEVEKWMMAQPASNGKSSGDDTGGKK